MRYLYFGALFFVVTLLQTCTFNPFVWNEIKPDFFLLFVIYINLYLPGNQGLWWGGGCGFLEDILSSGSLGSATLSKFISGYSVSFIKEKIVLDNPLVQSLLVFIVSIIESVFRFFLLNFLGFISLEIGTIILLIFTQAFLTTIIAPFFFWFVRKGQLRLMRS